MPQKQLKQSDHKTDIASAQPSIRGDFRPINPTHINVPKSTIPDEQEVERIVEILKNKGSLPNIIITPDNTLVDGINALEAAKQMDQQLVLATIQKTKFQSSKIQLADIRLNGGTQSRAGINQNIVDEYALFWCQNVKFPPVIVFYDGDNYWLADGFHRCLSAKQAGLTEIEADIRQGTCRDAVLYSVGANAQHGLRRTNEDKRRAVTTLLSDEQWSQWSDREIARRTGVHHDTVGRLRTELSGGFRQIEERKVERNGTTYTQKAKDKRWTPKETEIVEITEGDRKGEKAEVRVVLGNQALCFVGDDDKHTRIYLSHLKPTEEVKTQTTSSGKELQQQQQDLGLGKRSQALPDVERNTGIAPTEQMMQSTAVNLTAVDDSLVSEVAIALIRLTPKQMYEAMSKAQKDLDTQQLEAIWQALQLHFAHKAA